MTSPTPTPSQPTTESSGNVAIFFFCGLVIGIVGVGFALAGRAARLAQPEGQAHLELVPAAVKPVHSSNTPGLENVYRLSDSLLCGSSPQDDAGFGTLVRLGVKTIISVDGALPEVDSAKAHGLKYIHLPLSYRDVPRDVLIKLNRVAAENPGTIYVHCHHGKHRGPAAAVALWKCRDKSVSDEEAVATLKKLGTSDRYAGLYDSVRKAVRPTPAELAASTEVLSAASPVPPMVETMAAIDRMFDRVTETARDSTMHTMQMTTAYDIGEMFREAARLSDVSENLKAELDAAAEEMDRLAELIRHEMKAPTTGSSDREKLVSAIKTRCADCHAKYRD